MTTLIVCSLFSILTFLLVYLGEDKSDPKRDVNALKAAALVFLITAACKALFLP
jgi:hypothetical protein